MKKLLFCVFSFLPVALAAQNLQVRVQDSLTAEPLPFANLYFKAASIGASTSMNGNATFAEAKLRNPDTLMVTYVGYKPKAMPFNGEKHTIVIQLAPTSNNLAEVVITTKKPMKPEKIVKNAIKNSKENYRSADMILNGMYREALYENDKCIQLNEAVAKVYYTGYPKPKLDSKIWKSWYYDERYAFDLEGDYYFDQFLDDFNSADDKQEIVTSRISDEQSRYGLEITLIGDPLLILAYDKIKYQYDFLNPGILNRYSFKTEGVEVHGGEACYVISFYPKPSGKRFSIDQSRKNKSAIYIGRMYIAVSSFAVVGFEYKLAVARDFGFFARRMPLDYTVKASYAKNGEKWNINSILQTETRSIHTKPNGDAVLHVAQRAFQVMSIDTTDVRPIPDSLEFKSTKYSSLRYYSKNYNAAYWDTVPIEKHYLTAPDIVADLGGKDALRAQFFGNGHIERKDLPQPIAPRHAYSYHYPDTTITDSLHWMSLPGYKSEFQSYLYQENKYAKNYLLPDRKYQRKLFDQLNTFYKKSPETVTGFQKYSFGEDSLGQSFYYFQKDTASPKTEIFNFDGFQGQNPDAFITRIRPNESDSLLLLTYGIPGVQGDYGYVFPFGKSQPIDSLSDIYTIEWYNPKTLIYTQNNNLGRSDRLLIHPLGSASNTLVFSEPDVKFDVEVVKKDGELFCTLQSKVENEIYHLRETEPKLQMEVLRKRKAGVMNYFEIEGDSIYLLTNDENSADKIWKGSLDNPDQWEALLEARKGDYFVRAVPFGESIVVSVYQKSIPKLMLLESGKSKLKEVDTGLGIGQYYLIRQTLKDTLDFYFSSPSVPLTHFKYAIKTKKLVEVQQIRIPAKSYTLRYTYVKRLWAKAADGTKIPMTITGSLLHESSQKRTILKVYGAYGANTTPEFDAEDAILIDQGYKLVYAHVRGESIMGTDWYRDGRQLSKRNSGTDLVACAKYLIDKGITSPQQLTLWANSAGGVAAGQAVNEHPELFNSVIFSHPYLDVINTMMNDTLPLTTDEYKELGNPKESSVFDYMMSYSPYQNLKKQSYPNMIFLSGYVDYRTPAWQIAEYVARLRAVNQGNSHIIMITDMKSGHNGNTAGKEWVKLFAETYSFLHLNWEE